MPAAPGQTYILLLGEEADPQIQLLVERLRETALADPIILDSAKRPMEIHASWSVDGRTSWIETSNQMIPFTQVQSAFWRQLCSPETDDQAAVAEVNTQSAMLSLMCSTPFPWINDLQAYRLHQTKPVQLAMVNALGIATPKTLITSSVDQGWKFLRQLGRSIVKPVWGGGYAELLEATPAGREHLEQQLARMPCTLQSFIAGEDVRTYVIADAVYSVRIAANSIDFRCDENHTLHSWQLPSHMADRARQITHTLGMQWTAIDWRVDATGQYTFLEANFSPMFYAVESRTGLPLSTALARLLCNPCLKASFDNGAQERT